MSDWNPTTETILCFVLKGKNGFGGHKVINFSYDTK